MSEFVYMFEIATDMVVCFRLHRYLCAIRGTRERTDPHSHRPVQRGAERQDYCRVPAGEEVHLNRISLCEWPLFIDAGHERTEVAVSHPEFVSEPGNVIYHR